MAPGVLDYLALRGENVMNNMQIFEAVARGELTPAQGAELLIANRPRLPRWLAFLLALGGCASVNCAQPGPPIVAPVIDSGDADPCQVRLHVDNARLIRLPDGGTYNVPCAPSDSGG